MTSLLSWSRRAAVRDWSWTAVVLVVGLGDIAKNQHTTSFPGSVAANIAFLVGSSLPLAVRRLWPTAVPVLVIAGVSAWDLALYPPQNQASFEAFLLMLAASYIVGSDLRGRRQLVTTTVLAVWILPGWLFGVGSGQSPGDVFPALAFTVLAWVVGFSLRRRKEQVAVQRARADELAFEQGRMAAEAVIEERSRIARELHDVVAHSLSLMVVQASAERRSLAVGNGGIDTASQVLESVEVAGRAALVELRRLLGLVRRTDQEPSRGPQPSLRHLDVLLEGARNSGVKITFEVSGAGIDGLPAGIDLTAYRIVQESLTNALKHSSAESVCVRITRHRHDVEIEVTDDGSGAGVIGLPFGGHGLVGMRERVAVYGGTIEVGPRLSEPGFRVHVRLPVTDPVGAY